TVPNEMDRFTGSRLVRRSDLTANAIVIDRLGLDGNMTYDCRDAAQRKRTFGRHLDIEQHAARQKIFNFLIDPDLKRKSGIGKLQQWILSLCGSPTDRRSCRLMAQDWGTAIDEPLHGVVELADTIDVNDLASRSCIEKLLGELDAYVHQPYAAPQPLQAVE